MEPSGLVTDDGKRPDSPVREAADVGRDTCDSRSSAAAAELTDSRKSAKYPELLPSYIFQPNVVETFGSVNSSTAAFVAD